MANSLIYNSAKQKLFEGGTFDLSGTPGTTASDLRLVLVNQTYEQLSDATKQTHDAYDDITAASGEISGGTYVAGGLQFSNPTGTGGAGSTAPSTFVCDISTNTARFLFSGTQAVTWATATITNAYGAVLCLHNTTNSLRYLICYLDFGGARSSSNGNFVVSWSGASGVVLTLT